MKKFLIVLSTALLFVHQPLYIWGAEDLLKRADLMLDMMEYKSAIVNYLRILSQNPEQRDVRKNMAYAYYKLDRTDEAMKYLKEEVTYYPDNTDAYDFLVSILFESNKLDEANQILGKLGFPIRLTLKNLYSGGLGCFILGVHFKKNEEYEKAESFFRKAMVMGFDRVRCYVQLIDMEISRGLKVGQLEFKESLELTVDPESVLAEAMEAYQFRPEFLFLIGWTYLRKSKTIPSYLSDFNKCLELAVKFDADFKDALFNLACLGYNFGDYKKASEYFGRILDLEPENEEIRFYLNCSLSKLEKAPENGVSLGPCPGQIAFSRKFIDDPERTYHYKLHNDPGFVLNNINNIGTELAGNGEFREALKRFDNGLKIAPENPEIHYNMAIVYSWLEDLENAEQHALRALRTRDTFGRIPFPRKLEILKENKDETERKTKIPLSKWNFEAALKEGNYFLDAWDTLGVIYFKKQDYEKSYLAFKRVLDIYEGDALGHYNLGCIYWIDDDRQKAEEEWKKAIKYEKEAKKREESTQISKNQLAVSLNVFKKPVAFYAHKALGELYIDQELPDKALKEFTAIVELEPSDPEPYYQLGKIYYARSTSGSKNVREAIAYLEKYLYLGGEKQEEAKEILKSLKKLRR